MANAHRLELTREIYSRIPHPHEFLGINANAQAHSGWAKSRSELLASARFVKWEADTSNAVKEPSNGQNFLLIIPRQLPASIC